jgi:hypothetical protein
VPAIPLALAKSAGYAGRIGDASLVMLFASGVFLLLAGLVSVLWLRHFRDLPAWTLLAALPVLGLAPPVMWLINNPLVYEAALAAAEFFFIAGLFAAYIGLTHHTARPVLYLVPGIAWALAIGCQFTQVIAVGVAVLLLALWSVRGAVGPGRRQRPVLLAALVLPPVLMLLALGWYNFARFGSVLEFGYRYQLAVVNLHEHYEEIFQPIFALPNAYNYLLNPFLTSDSFPYIFPRYGSTLQGFPVPIPRLYYSEAIAGLLYSAPVLVFAVVPVVWWLRSSRSSSLRDLIKRWAQDPLHWLMSTITLALIPNAAVLLFFYYSAPRYLMAVMPLLMILSVVGFWMGYRRLMDHQRGRRLMVASAGILSVWTVVVSMLLAVSSSQDRFSQGNPELIESINRLLGG